MKALVVSEDLHKNISFLNHAVSVRSQLPVLSNILIETNENKINFSATDLEIGIQISINANVEENGRVLVSAKPLLDLFGSLPSVKDITIQTQDKSLIITTEKTRSSFQTSDPDEFPMLYEDKGKETAIIKGGEIQKDLVKVVFAASVDMARPALSGVLIRRSENETTIAATDGYRLSLKKMVLEGKEGEEQDIIVPARVLKEAMMFKDGGDISVYVSKKTNQIVFLQEGKLLVGKLIESKFPDYEKIIPQEHDTRVVFDKEEMQKAVKTSSIFAREANGIIRFSVTRDKITVSANTPSLGENRVEVEAKLEGEENEIAFNPRYVLELLSSIDEEEMVFEMTGPLNPGVFKIKDDSTFLHLIMPVRVQG